MDSEKYNRSVNLLCPTCGSNQFSWEDENEPDTALVTCSACGRELTRAELLRENSENIDENVKEIGRQAMEDVQRQFKKSLADAFKGSKFFKVK